MAISRPILLALAGALLALAAFYAMTGARSSGEDSKQPAPERSPAKGKSVTPHKGAAVPAEGRSAPASARPAPSKRKRESRAPAARPGLPADVSRALTRDRTVVLFFFQRGSADDAATARAVAAVRARRRARVFSAPISRLAHYRAVTAGVGVSQAPAVVILRRGRGARLVEGFVDPETLMQQVADAR